MSGYLTRLPTHGTALSPMQRRVYQFVATHLQRSTSPQTFGRTAIAPSVRELASALDKSIATVHQHLMAIETKGYWRRLPHRGIVFLKSIDGDTLAVSDENRPMNLHFEVYR